MVLLLHKHLLQMNELYLNFHLYIKVSKYFKNWNFVPSFLSKLSMNIFFLHLDPEQCAKMHLDKHVVKMILESLQLLCSAHHATESPFKPPYKLSHKNHPSAIWVRESIANYNWLVCLTEELCKEYTYRYGKVHKSEQYIQSMRENIPHIPDIGFTQPKLAMPDEYKEQDVVDSYRNYYFYGKSHLHAWKKREVPDWINEYI